MGVTVGTYGATGSDGWTVVTETSPFGEGTGFSGAGTRKIYVSSSTGNDSNDGSSGSPVATIAHGSTLVRSGFPDWLLLKCDDSWTDDVFNTSGFVGSFCSVGQSATAPTLVSSYGSGARPLLRTNISFNPFDTPGSFCPLDYCAIIGLEFYAYARDPNNVSFDPAAPQNGFGAIAIGGGQSVAAPSHWFLIEDCKFSFYPLALDFGIASPGDQFHDIAHQNVIIRRNVSAYQYPTDSASNFSSGYHTANILNLLVEENISIHDGWNSQVVLATTTEFAHGFYLQTNDSVGLNVTIRGNIATLSSAYGIQQRPAGLSYNNLMVQCGLGMSLGNPQVPPTCASNQAYDNVIQQSIGYVVGDGSASNPTWGIVVYPTVNSCSVYSNIMSHSSGTSNHLGIGIGTQPEDGSNPTSHNATISNNIVFDWAAQEGPPSGQSGNIIDWSTGHINTVVGNRQSIDNTNSFGFPHPDRTIETYDSSLGGPGTLAHFNSLLVLQSKANWNPNLTADVIVDYIQEGFGIFEGITTLHPQACM